MYSSKTYYADVDLCILNTFMKRNAEYLPKVPNIVYN